MKTLFFHLETPLDATVTRNQKKDGYRFVVDNTNSTYPFDFYNARISVDFKVVLAANGGNIAENDHNGIVNGSHSLINNFKVNLNGKKVYDLNDANHCVNIKNLLEYSQIYADTTATNEFFFLDTSRSAEERILIYISDTQYDTCRRTNSDWLRQIEQSWFRDSGFGHT